MARPERFELPTYSSGGCRSIQLSYGRVPFSLHAGSGAIKCAEHGKPPGCFIGCMLESFTSDCVRRHCVRVLGRRHHRHRSSPVWVALR
jgi:hypothetical protein